MENQPEALSLTGETVQSDNAVKLMVLVPPSDSITGCRSVSKGMEMEGTSSSSFWHEHIASRIEKQSACLSFILDFLKFQFSLLIVKLDYECGNRIRNQ